MRKKRHIKTKISKILAILIAILSLLAINLLVSNNSIKDSTKDVVIPTDEPSQAIGTTTLDITYLSTASVAPHQHIYKSVYNTSQHWNECIICAQKINVANHSYTDHWYTGVPDCSYVNYSIRTCNCGYSYRYTMPHTPGTVWNSTGPRQIHYQTCQNCGTWTGSGHCVDASGRNLNCLHPGTCVYCGNVVTNKMHYLNNDGVCVDCGIKLLNVDYISGPTNSSNNATATVKVKVTPMNGAVLTGNFPRWTGTTNYSSNTITSTNLANGAKEFTEVYTFNPSRQQKCTLYLGDGYLVSYQDQQCYMNTGSHTWVIWQDRAAPTISGVQQIDQKTINGWATIKQLIVSGTEDLSDVVYVTIKNRSTGEVVVDRASANVTNHQYSYSATPEIEGNETGTYYTVSVTDRVDNTRSTDILIRKTDSKPPQMTSSTSIETPWTKNKEYTVTSTDNGSGNVQVAFNDLNAFAYANASGNTYTRTYNFVGDVYQQVKAAIYVKDYLGNINTEYLYIDKIDNTKPTITADNKTTVRSSTANAYVAKFTINANDVNTILNKSGSGVTHYMMTIDDAVPSESDSRWQSSNSFQTTENGYYYFWAKDLVGNVSSVREVYVSDLTAQYKVNHYLQDIDTTTNQPKSTYTLANEETFYGIIGRTYHLSTKIYDGFESPAIQRITVDSSGNQVVNYYYTRKTDCEYTVKYLELNTNTQLERPRTIANQTYGALINSVNEKIDIEGYNYNSAVPEQMTLGTGENTITLYYTKVNNLKYYVHYINEDTNEEIRPVKVVENQTYQDVVSTLPNKIDIDGYNFSRITPETLEISLEESLNVVNIYYNQRRDLIYTVDYLDVDTNATLHEPKVYSNQVFNTTINGQREIIGIEGYDYHSIAPAILTIGTDNNENIINIYYKRITNLSYTINYYLQGTTTKLATSVVETNQPYDKEVLAEDYIIPIDGYNYAGESKDKIRLKINNEENVIDIYYTRREGIEYTVNYLEKGTNTRLKTSKTTGATFGDVKEALDEKVEIAGYNYKDAIPQSLTITTNSSTNVINIYYEKKSDLEYTVYFAEKDSPHNDIKSAKTIRNQTFGNRIQASTQVEPITGFTYSSADPTELVIRENNEENIMNLYYVRRTDLTYTINYIEAGTTHKIKTSKVVNNVAFEKQVFARFEAIEIDGFVYQNADVESITVGENAANNVINLYYRRLNNLSYTVNYYEKNTTTRLRQSKIVEGKSFEDVINSANEVEDIPGYNFSEADKSTLVISSDINANVINLYYTKRTDISYKVNYYIEGTRIKAKESKVVSNKKIGDIVYALDERVEIDRYIYRGSEQDSIIIDADTNNNVINLYYARISNLIVRFLDKNTNEPVRNELRYTSLVGDNYEIGDINTEVEGYELVQSPSSTSGQFAYNDTYLTYYYSRSTYVKVKYLDKGTNEELADTEIINGYVGKQYTTVKKDIPGYNYFNNTGNTSGYMASGETLVIYYYTQDVTLTVQYLDKYTEEELSNTITQEGYVGKQYTTTLKNINGYTHVETQGIPSGVMTEGENKVIYYYAKDTKVTVKYQNNNTHEDLRTSEEISGYQGKHYTTEPKEISNWTLVGDSGNTTGEMAREGTTVIYYYQKQATVRVKYIDEETGETIQEDRVIEGSIGQEYSVNPATISGYKYLSSSGNETGRMGRNEIVVTFKYGKASGLVIKYVDLYSQEEISDEKIYEAYSSDTYDVTNERKTISNYTYITDSGNTIGEYRNTLTEVIFYYSTNTTGKLKYKDLYTGEEIQDEETIYGYEGKEISYEPDTINSYTFIKTDINLPARFKKEGTEVNNLYAKNSKMKVKYRDYYTGELIEEKTIPGYQGKEYNPSDVLEEIDGYKVLKQYEDIGGEFPRDDSELTVYYAKISNIIIQYIDANSNQKLRNDKIIEKQSGDTYDVSSEKKAIDNYVLINDPTTKGTILQEDIVIVFKYGKKTQIIVEITDEETGEVIERIVIDGYEGMPFSIDVYEREGYIYKGSSAPLSGIMKLENGTIKLYYMKDPNYNKKGDEDDSDKDKGQEEVNPETEDETTARTILPQTGETITYVVIAVVIIAGLGIFTFIKQYEK